MRESFSYYRSEESIYRKFSHRKSRNQPKPVEGEEGGKTAASNAETNGATSMTDKRLGSDVSLPTQSVLRLPHREHFPTSRKLADPGTALSRQAYEATALRCQASRLSRKCERRSTQKISSLLPKRPKIWSKNSRKTIMRE